MMTKEWLETDGLGGFASCGADTIRTRRYHALLLTATNPPTGRFVLVNGFDAWIETSAGRYAISSQRYAPDIIHPDGHKRIESFTTSPWPTWIFRLEDGTRVRQEILMQKGSSLVAIIWNVIGSPKDVLLHVRPFLSGRDYHSMHHENDAFQFQPEAQGQHWIWQPYAGVPAVHAITNGKYNHDPQWYRNFAYEQERERGLDFTEDLASPGIFQWDLAAKEAYCLFGAGDIPNGSARDIAVAMKSAEQERRQKFMSRLDFASDSYLVQRKSGKTIVAGYPWFTDWGRDTFIALRGLCLSRGETQIARDILVEWASSVSEGMLPNRFPDAGEQPEYNSVDASLWYVIAVHDFLTKVPNASETDRKLLQTAIHSILTGYERGTRFGIRMDEDGLLSAGQPGVQLTWMDAKIGDWVVTPRIGKPVEIQALWLNALKIAGKETLFKKGCNSFHEKFWNANGLYLYDVIDVDHKNGITDDRFRPNQIFAIGGLPYSILTGERAHLVVDLVEAHLWTPLGLRSLAPGSTEYALRYQGGVRERDSVYHQGTVWPWLIGPFVEAWLRTHGNTKKAKQEAEMKFLKPILNHLEDAGLDHVSEIADAEPPHTPRGCPFQAWSVGEVIRLQELLRS